MIFDSLGSSSATAKSDGRAAILHARLRKIAIFAGLALLAVGLKFFAFVPGMMEAAPLAMFSAPGPAPAGNSMVVQPPTLDANGVKYYSVTSAYQGGREQTVRVLEPTNPAPGRPRRLLYVLPVEADITNRGSRFGDGLEELRRIDAQNRFNMTLIAPSFPYEPWYGDNASDKANSMEAFIVRELVPWGDKFLPPGTTPQRFLIGFSKPGNGALTLIFRHPDAFAAAAAWDAPVQLRDINAQSGLPANFGTQENYERYFIPGLVKSCAKPFLGTNRLWISGDQGFWTADMNLLHGQLTAAGIHHTWVAGGARAHNWSSGWLEGAVSGLDAIASQLGQPDSKNRHAGRDASNGREIASARQVLRGSATP